MLKFKKGNMFNLKADILVNAVNCKGIMGKGVAKTFKEKYPAMYNNYRFKCENNEVLPGVPFVWEDKSYMFNIGIIIINFPTKDDWRDDSKYDYIESGLVWFREYLINYTKENKNKYVHMPALGCGLGNLNFELVQEMIIKHLDDIEDIDITVFNY